MTNNRPNSSETLPCGAFLRMDHQPLLSTIPNDNSGGGEQQREYMCRATMAPWDTASCIPLRRKSSNSLKSLFSGFDDVPELVGAWDSDNGSNLNDSASSTMDGVSSLLSISASSTSLRQRQKHQKHLRWGKVEMRFYPVMPGDHPDTMYGPPVCCHSIGKRIVSNNKFFRSSSSPLPGTTLLPFRSTLTRSKHPRRGRPVVVTSCVSLG
jgi:hypothetical protein